MATITHGIGTHSTANAGSYVSGAFTPASNDLIVAFCSKSQSSTDDSPQLVGSLLSFAQVRQEEHVAAQQHRLTAFVATSLAAASSQTVTYNMTGDNGTGSNILVVRVAGMSLLGAAAVRQQAGVSNGSANPPATTFAGVCLTGNPVLSVLACADNPPALTPPTSFSGLGDGGYTTPDQGAQSVARNSGHTIATVTWGSSPITTYTMISLELDTSVGGATPMPTTNAFVTTMRERRPYA